MVKKLLYNFSAVHDISWIFLICDPCAKFGRGPTVVSKKGGTDRQTDMQAGRQVRQAGAETPRDVTDRCDGCDGHDGQTDRHLVQVACRCICI